MRRRQLGCSYLLHISIDEDQCYRVWLEYDWHRDYLRFLWWPEGDLSAELAEYQMNVHIFGAISSPSCANLALKSIADDFSNEISQETADTLRSNFYVDDCLRSEDTEEIAMERLNEVMSACSMGGFTLSKLTSNSPTVLEQIPVERRSEAAKKVDLGDDFPTERALGVQWSVSSDELGFRIALKEKPATRRGILSTICSVYDPLGIASPVILQGKKLLQELCKCNTDWDDAIPDENKLKWERWKSTLPKLGEFTMPRSLKP